MASTAMSYKSGKKVRYCVGDSKSFRKKKKKIFMEEGKTVLHQPNLPPASWAKYKQSLTAQTFV